MVEEVFLPDGNIVRRYSNGDRVIHLANGQQEVHCSDYKVTIVPSIMKTCVLIVHSLQAQGLGH